MSDVRLVPWTDASLGLLGGVAGGNEELLEQGAAVSVHLVLPHGGRGLWQLNPLIAYKGNGDEQRTFLAELRAMALENGFPDVVGPSAMQTFGGESDVC